MVSVKRPRKKTPMAPEKAAQNAFLEALELKGIRAWRVNSGNILGSYTSKRTGKTKSWMVKGAPNGTPDTVVHIGGSVWAFVEFKKPGGKLRPMQELWFTWAKRNGVLCAVHENAGAALLEVSVWRAEWEREARYRAVENDW